MEIQLWSVKGFIVLPWEVTSSMETCPSQRALLLAWFPLHSVNSPYKCLRYGLRLWPAVKTQLFFLRSNSQIRLNLTGLKESVLLNFSSLVQSAVNFVSVSCFQNNCTTLEFVFCFLDLVKHIYLFLSFYKVGWFFPRMEFSLLNAFILPLAGMPFFPVWLPTQ